ncbi:hypothetical protein [Pedobacter sp. FW305-3-2-15-E-R2A2]|jgi:hypothetical protein|uniref:hypothetical protein n=1 Tax=Pedobacter sp. FW305-3-2-15-E-R2A2 TaxID=3140251 RepID=UPI003140B847
MKSLELKNLGVQEMNDIEMKYVEGGGLTEIIGSVGGIIKPVVGTVNAVVDKLKDTASNIGAIIGGIVGF